MTPTGDREFGLSLAPVLVIFTVLLAGLAALELVSSAWVFGNLPPQVLAAVPGLGRVGLYLALLLPPVLVIGVGVWAARLRFRPVPPHRAPREPEPAGPAAH